MPFIYKIPIPNELPKGDIILKEWLLNYGDFVNIDYGLAIITLNGTDFEIRANGEGVFREQLADEGEIIKDRTQICTISADGEKIPYDRPYSKAIKLNT